MGVFGRAGPPKEAAGPPRVPQVPQIMVLGTYHMANPGRDYANIRADDVLAPRRQAEIAEVCGLLAPFAPTSIAIEVPATAQDDLDRRFAAHVGGEAELRRNESDQIGFRLAKMLGHERIHAVDYRSDLDLAGVLAWARAHGQEALGARMQREVNRIAGDVQARMDRMTLRQILREDNSPEYDRLHGLYLTMATIGDTGQGEYIGAEITAAWYRRNIIIFSNVARLAASPDDRVLVIIGSGHGALLRQLVRECPDYRLVDVAEYL
ncbi:MAG: DUF5694 domain-containing protein [Chloroflexota bacterium]|nr:DUF5694 domain-containing protein [Chloroflexota bacterium]